MILQEYSFSDYPFAVGSNLSLADIVIHNFVVDFFDNKEGIKNATKDCKKLLIIAENVSKHPEIIEWKETRPDTKL